MLPAPARQPLKDAHGRAITDLRISITDRCNYRCVYCRTGNEGALFPELPLADYLRIASIFVSQGISKIRLTGGEPLLRADLLKLVEELSRLRTPQGEPLDLAITTNGHLLAELAAPLKRAGLHRVTVSMDAVDREKFARITRSPNGYDAVVNGIRAAKAAGLDPVKVNCVLVRGFNEDQILPFAEFARAEGVAVRFIEFMPLEEGRVWEPGVVVPLHEVVAAISTRYPLVPLPNGSSETARKFAFADGVGEIGVIAPVSLPFCGACSRIRVTSDGKVRTCLFSVGDHEFASKMRAGASDSALVEHLHAIVARKEARHHIGEPGFQKPGRSMVHIGG